MTTATKIETIKMAYPTLIGKTVARDRDFGAFSLSGYVANPNNEGRKLVLVCDCEDAAEAVRIKNHFVFGDAA